MIKHLYFIAAWFIARFWLALPRDDCHFFYIFVWKDDDCHFWLPKQKHLPMDDELPLLATNKNTSFYG
jgi:hypothetical protein